MEDGVEVLLEVDALGQAVGRDQDALVVEPRQLLDPLPALLVADLARDRAHLESANDLQQLGEPRRQVVGGGDEAAEDDRPVAVLEQQPSDVASASQLAVAAPGPSSRPRARA